MKANTIYLLAGFAILGYALYSYNETKKAAGGNIIDNRI